ncbi:P-selectin glycoprotein ligand 1 [Thomomys bottae]
MLPPLLLLLLALLGEPWRNGAEAGLGPAPFRARRQVPVDDDDLYEDYNPEGTDLPETLNSTRDLGADVEPLHAVTTLGQRASAEPGTPELPTVDTATKKAVGPPTGPSAGGTPWRPVSAEVTTEPTTTIVSTVAALSTHEILSTGQAATETETKQPASVETQTMLLAATEAGTIQPAAMEAKATRPAATETGALQPSATEAKTTWLAATEVLTVKPTLAEAVSTEPTATVVLSLEPLTTTSQSTEPPATITVVLREKGVPQNTVEAANNLPGMDRKAGQVVPLASSVAPSPTGASERIPVRQCLLAILILALVATVFLVCTVVLAVRLSRQSHTYPVRSYSPTEMVCISSLLPDAAEGGPTVANGGLPKSQRPKAQALEDHDGDDLTLHSFLP